MAENNENYTAGCDFKEAVCIDVGRVYDSCCDRDCIEDLRCFFSDDAQQIIDSAISVRLKNAEVLNVYVDVEQVNFNRGYYSCDLTFIFGINLEVFTCPHSAPKFVRGITSFNKKVILFGSEGNVKVFSNKDSRCKEVCKTSLNSNAPKCVVQTVEPVALSSRLGTVGGCCDAPGAIPETVAQALGGCVPGGITCDSKTVFVTLGLFSVVQLIRNVQMLIPVYDFCIPEKQCNDTADQPCDVFRKIKFPTDDFFPPSSSPEDCGCCE